MPQTLLNKVAVITGAGSGIGRATAELFLHEGAKVVLFGRRAEPLEETAEKAPARAMAVAGDVTVEADLARLAASASRRFGQIDVLVTAAGMVQVAPFVEAPPDHLEQQLAVNLSGTWHTIRMLAPQLNRRASVICLTGRLGDQAGLAAFHATKAAVASLAQSLAVELASRQIRVNCIAPGPADTPHWDDAGVDRKATLKRLAGSWNSEPGEAIKVAEVALFLASDASSHVTGQEIVVGRGC